jgi:serine O-acetyltransferase
VAGLGGGLEGMSTLLWTGDPVLLDAQRIHAVAHWLYQNRVPVVPGLLRQVNLLVHKCLIYPQTKLGKGTELGYGGICVFIHPTARIGKGVLLSPFVIIGGRGNGVLGTAIIEDDVKIGVGATILGPVRIGQGAQIGANAVVTRDVPPHTVVVGAPAREIRRTGGGAGLWTGGPSSKTPAPAEEARLPRA